MPVAPSVTPSNAGDGIVLSLTGAWIVAAGKALETSATSLPRQSGRPQGHDRSRRRRPHGHRRRLGDRPRPHRIGRRRVLQAGYRGARPEHALLLHEAGYRPLEPPKPNSLSPRPNVARRGRRDGLRRRRRPDRHVDYLGEIVVMWRAAHPASHALALDLDGASPRDLFPAQRADHLADQLPSRRDRHATGHIPAEHVSARRPMLSTWSACSACASSGC